jgi:hypothetical protein
MAGSPLRHDCSPAAFSVADGLLRLAAKHEPGGNALKPLQGGGIGDWIIQFGAEIQPAAG